MLFILQHRGGGIIPFIGAHRFIRSAAHARIGADCRVLRGKRRAPAFFICWAAVILLPVLSIGITIVLFCLDRELSAESCAVSRRISELETRLEKLTRLSR